MGAAGSAEPPSDSQLRPDADWARVPPSCRPGGPSFPAELDAPEPAAPARTVTDACDIGRRAALTTRAPPTLDAAIDDGVIVKNPCRASSVRAPKRDTRKFEPWSVERVAAVGDSITERYAVMVAVGARLGIRQGEAFGLAEEDVDFLRGVVHIRRQIKIFKGRRKVFALPKGGKDRDIPLPESFRLLLAEHMQTGNHPPVPVTLPWKTLDGEPVTARLIFTTRQGTPINRNEWNRFVWKPALLRCRCSGNSGERLPRAPASLRERAPGARCGHPGAGRVPRAR